MKIVCSIEVDLSTYLIEDGNKIYKVFNLKPNEPIELPDDYALTLFENDFLKDKISEASDYEISNQIFTKENIEGLGMEQLYGIAKEAGLNPSKTWKRETLEKNFRTICAGNRMKGISKWLLQLTPEKVL